MGLTWLPDSPLCGGNEGSGWEGTGGEGRGGIGKGNWGGVETCEFCLSTEVV